MNLRDKGLKMTRHHYRTINYQEYERRKALLLQRELDPVDYEIECMKIEQELYLEQLNKKERHGRN